MNQRKNPIQVARIIRDHWNKSGKKHLILTGSIGSGKTTTMWELLKEETPVDGLTTAFRTRVAIELVAKRNQREEELLIGIRTKKGVVVQNRYFHHMGPKTLSELSTSSAELIYIDEVGRLEASSPEYMEQLLNLFREKKMIVIKRKEESALDPYLPRLRNVCLIDLDFIEKEENILKKYHEDKLANTLQDLNESKGNWNQRAEEFFRFSKRIEDDLTMQILSEHMDLSGKKVLDIGFGAGRYLLRLLQKGALVSGIELSDQMMNYAKQNLIENNRNPEEVLMINEAWEDVDIEKWDMRGRYDLVFLSMSPAISSHEMLEKAIRCTKQGLYMTGHVRLYDPLYHEISTKHYQQLPQENKSRIYHVFNLLYLDGYHPSFQMKKKKKTNETCAEELMPRYLHWLFHGTETEEDRKGLLQKLQEYETNGRIILETESTDAYLYCDIRDYNLRHLAF